MTADSTAAASQPQEGNVSRSASAGRETNPGKDGQADGPPVADVLLSLRGISKHFGPVTALDDVNLDVPAGRVTAPPGCLPPIVAPAK